MRPRAFRSRRLPAWAVIEAVEPRLLFATVSWIDPTGGDWDNPNNWSGSKVPTANDDVVIDLKTNAAQITHKETDADSAKSITSNQPIIITKGSLDLNGGDLSMSNKFTLHGGTILNATLITDKGGSYIIQQPTTFNNVTLDKSTQITVPSGDTLNVVNNLRFNSGSKLTVLSGGSVNGQDSAQGGAAFTGTGNIVLHGVGLSGPAKIVGQGTKFALTIGAHIIVTADGDAVINAQNTGGIINDGTISGAFMSNVTLEGTFGTFTNAGTINVVLEDKTTLTGSWSNLGTINNTNTKNTNGSLNLSGNSSHLGTIKSTSGGTVKVTGTIDLNGGTLNLNSTTGSWILDGGTIENGTINSTGGATLTLPPLKTEELDDLNLDDLHLDVPSGADLSIQGYLDLGGGTLFSVSAGGKAAAGGRIDFDGNETLPPSLLGTGTINFVGTGSHAGILNNQDDAQPLTISKGITIKGGDGTIKSVNGSAGGIVNQGSILPNIKGESINLSGGPFINQGRIFVSTVASLNGSGLPGGLQNVSGGSLGGTGIYIGNINSGGTLSPGAPNDTGSFEIHGNLALGSTSKIIEELGGTSGGQYSELNITGSASLAGKLIIKTYDNFEPAAGQTFGSIITYASETGKLTATGLVPGLLALPHIGATSTSLKITVPKLVFSVEPPLTAVAGDTLPAVQVQIENPNGSVITTDNSVVTLSVVTGPATFLTTATANNGVAIFSNVVLDTAGTYKFKATDGKDTPATSSSIVIVPAAVSMLAFKQIPTSATEGVAMSAVQVVLEDSFQNLVTDDTSEITMSLAAGPIGATLTGKTSENAVGGIASFSDLIPNFTGTCKLQASKDNIIILVSPIILVAPPG